MKPVHKILAVLQRLHRLFHGKQSKEQQPESEYDLTQVYIKGALQEKHHYKTRSYRDGCILADVQRKDLGRKGSADIGAHYHTHGLPEGERP